MTVFWALPDVRGTQKCKNKPGSFAPQRCKYDHFEMLKDRIGGMRWSEIAEKHGVPPTGKCSPASRARNLLQTSMVYRHLSPEELGRVAWSPDAPQP